jgi:diadenosine tetraphosphate (Ap4A) HIT family hydrolase
MESWQQSIAKTPTSITTTTCSFCDEFLEQGHSTRIIYESSLLTLVPTIGCFTPGYCLLLPRRHVRSFAELKVFELETVSSQLTKVLETIESQFGPTIIAEHGASQYENGAACCEHAHIHIIPVGLTDAARFIYISRLGLPIRIDRLEELKSLEGKPYLYLSTQEDEHLAWTDIDSVPRQFVRRVAAAVLGRPGDFDWRSLPFESNMKKTLDALGKRF